MFSWEWEDFEEIVRKYGSVVEDAGPLSTPVQHFTIQRDESLHLKMLTHAPVGARDSAVSYPSDTVRENRDSVTFASNMGLKMVAEGVHAAETRTIWQSDPPVAELRQDCSIHSLKGSLDPADRETKCVVDWLANVSPSFHWPDMTDEVSGIKRTRKFGHDPNRLEMNSSNATEGGSWNCVRLTVGGWTLFLATAKPTVAANVKRPGYIVYLGCPTDDKHLRIRSRNSALEEDVTKILTNKIRNLNAIPQSFLTTNLMKSLGLALGPREEKV